MPKGPTLAKQNKGTAKFYCPKEKKSFELEIKTREHTERGGDHLTAIDRQGHTVHTFGKRTEG